ncbi:dihydrolipoyl dehydrogenase [Singulisphaera acidiphila]|uniref:Dihydrolipoyl dehydrogenase n=1 Tax=Singulisphaera acidiphila (strain ATCC BAA-1392 / DSM 18658 / VKM B-2454 / MOB10) TaxID=886293 RepID=L0DP34_SINAD|nr:dihydrolipoyl dehydrogenase [Singulisphaera acidiphila]AGA30613.1 dihydrolipoamide dehydrogenase [Singulisphaera acidiphila DSM 18658]
MAPESNRYDLVVIGSGPGGYVAAIRAAQLGMKVACVEKRESLGGTCLNIGCIPSKALLDSSELYHLAHTKFAKHGIKVDAIGLDLPAMLARKDTVVKSLTDGLKFLFKKNKIEPVFGTARVASGESVVVRDAKGVETTLETKHILLATGSAPVNLPFIPFNGKTIVSSTEALTFDRVPEHLVVVGGGYIGLELGSVWKRLGAKVTVIEFLPRIVPMADLEVGTLLHKSLIKQGLEFHLETKVTGAKVEGDRVTVTAETKDGKVLTVPCDRVLVAVGRRPHTEGLGLVEAGVTVDPKTGKVPIDAHYRTNVPTISAIGDLVDGPMLAHKAEDEGVAFAEILAGKAGHVDYNTIPSVIYTWPEMASVGITEEQAKERKLEYKVGKYPFLPNGRAKAMDETEGLVKILADAKTDRVLGVHIFGPRASDLIAEAVTIMEFAGSAEDIARISHAHPTLSEAVREAAMAVDRRAIHG